jgi:hypothetical protein
MDEPPDAAREPDDDQLVWDELASVIRQSPHPVYNKLVVDAGLLLSLFASGAFLRAYCEELGKRYAGSTADWTSRVLVRRKRNAPDKTELTVPIDGSEVVIVLDADSLTDEAWLALLDVDLRSEDVRGRALSWDAKAQVWLPVDDQ